jgi:hypothetical protein
VEGEGRERIDGRHERDERDDERDERDERGERGEKKMRHILFTFRCLFFGALFLRVSRDGLLRLRLRRMGLCLLFLRRLSRCGRVSLFLFPLSALYTNT